MDKLTKTVATVGPATESDAVLSDLIRSGVNVFRFNLKHNTLAWHGQQIARVRACARALDTRVGVLIDLQGPEIRVNVAGGELALVLGQRVTLGADEVPAGQGFSVDRPQIIPHTLPGQHVLVDDGKFNFEVVENNGATLTLVSHSQGILHTRKSLSAPSAEVALPALTDADHEALAMGAVHSVDFVALSFVRQAADIDALRAAMNALGLRARIIAKLETRTSLNQLNQIMGQSDALMVARGDLGVAIPFEQVPYYQKDIIRQCVERGIPVITATQMMESTIESPTATRAEVSDVANAVYDSTDATMLSGETAYGKYPVEAVQIMAKTCGFVEQTAAKDARDRFAYDLADQEEMICDAAYNLALTLDQKHVQVGGFLVFTQTGRTARKLSRYRPKVPIYAFTPNETVAGGLTISYGVLPIVAPDLFAEQAEITQEGIGLAKDLIEARGLYDRGKFYIVLHGDVWAVEGRISTLRMLYPSA